MREKKNQQSDISNPSSNQNSDNEDFIIVDSRDTMVDNLSIDFSKISHTKKHQNKRKKDNTTIETINQTVIEKKQFIKCVGFKSNIDMYKQFPFQRFDIDDLEFVFENGSLHSNRRRAFKL